MKSMAWNNFKNTIPISLFFLMEGTTLEIDSFVPLSNEMQLILQVRQKFKLIRFKRTRKQFLYSHSMIRNTISKTLLSFNGENIV